MNPLDTYFVNQSHNPGKLTFVNASFWEKRTAIHKPRRPFNFDLKTYPSRTILREVSRVSSLILRAKPWLAKKVLRHGNRFVARVRRRYFSDGEKRRPEMRLRFAGYIDIEFCESFNHEFLTKCKYTVEKPGIIRCTSIRISHFWVASSICFKAWFL